MKIGIDLDNTISNMTEQWLKLYNNDFNDSLTVEDIKGWDIENYVKKECGLKIFNYLIREFFEITVPLPYSVEVTERLSKQHELYIVTASTPALIKPKAKWLVKWFPHIDIKNLITVQDKSLINVDLLIDDASHNVINFPRRSILIDYAWNRGVPDEITRVSNWIEVEKYIENIK